ncbi:MAG: ABC transporter permease [Defluviitaleaceae bacterium]|nr:ABC transporter permease [Defluviitaleaceae bacterium]
MSNWDVLVMCLRNMFKRKLRTFLTVLGVMVGTAAIVLMISLGLATEAHHQRQMEDAENDMTLIDVHMTWPEGTTWDQMGNPIFPEGTPLLNDAMVDRITSLQGVHFASPRMSGTVFLRADPYYMESWNVVGIRAEAMPFMGLPIAEGRVLQEGDTFAVVFGATAEHAFELLGSTWETRADRQWGWQWQGQEIPTFVDVMNTNMRLSFDRRFVAATDGEQMELTGGIRPIPSYNIEVVGLLAPHEQWGADRQIFMDIEVLLYLQNERLRAEREVQDDWQWLISPIRERPQELFNHVMVRATDVSQTSRVAREIEELGFHTSYAGQWLNMMLEGQRQQQQLLAAIGAISLIIAAIGIANTMIMAVYERTREIGIMKVIGAAIKDIRRLFLLESAMIGFFGGLFGVGLSLIGSYVMNNFDVPFLQGTPMPEWMGVTEVIDPSLVTPWLCGVALLFAAVIGLVSGYFPARRATKLSALAAIRSE